MTRVIETESTEHAQEVASALLEAAGDPLTITTVSGRNGFQVFAVPDDFPDVDIPDAPGPPSEAAAPGPAAPRRGARKAAAKTAASGDE